MVSGMGSELGSLVASLLEAEPWVGDLMGIDVDPPRRRLRKAQFQRVEPHEHTRIVDLVAAFDPHIIVHIAVWEPDARAALRHAKRMTEEFASAVFAAAAAQCESLQHLVVRSAAEAYGRRRDCVECPDESTPLDPTSEFGRMAVLIEQLATAVGEQRPLSVGLLRLAPILGPHVPSPLGRLLRQPAVPYSLLTNPSFSVIRDTDAAAAFVMAARTGLAEPLNIVADGEMSAWHALRRGKRIPLPLAGPEWAFVRRLSHIAGAPVPDHVVELLTRGRTINGDRARRVYGFTPQHTTAEVIDRLYAWPDVIRVVKPLAVLGQQRGAA